MDNAVLSFRLSWFVGATKVEINHELTGARARPEKRERERFAMYLRKNVA